MVELELDKSAVKTIEKALETLKEDRVRRVCQAASKRAATTARKAGTKHYVISTPLKVYRS